MAPNKKSSVFDRLWSRLEERYGADDIACSCSVDGEALSVLEQTNLSREDFAAYQRGDQTIADLTAKVDADLNPGQINDARTLIEELSGAHSGTQGKTRTS